MTVVTLSIVCLSVTSPASSSSNIFGAIVGDLKFVDVTYPVKNNIVGKPQVCVYMIAYIFLERTNISGLSSDSTKKSTQQSSMLFVMYFGEICLT